jgi:hypothetical protein
MLEIAAGIIVFLSIAVVTTLVLAGIMTLLGVVKGIDLEHLHDDEE